MYQSTKGNVNTLERQQYDDFDNPRIRQAFIRKVFMIIWVQIMFTLAVIAVVTLIPALSDFIREHHFLIYIAMAVVMVFSLLLACFESLRRNHPTNLVLLFIYTFALAFMISCLCIFIEPEVIFIALGITAVVVFILIVFALQTKIDFTVCGCGLFIAALLLLIFGIVCIFIPSKTMIMVYCSLGVFLFSIYLIFDVQLMMSGNHHYAVSPEDYVFSAMSIYTDIIMIFMFILNLLQGCNS